MPMINFAAKEITCKIVYYGPGLGGKTTNIKYIHSKLDKKSKLMSLATEKDRTLFFDFMPLDLGGSLIPGFTTRFQLFTVPGQVYYNTSRKIILKGADGVVFVADSQIERFEDNIDSLENLQENLMEVLKKGIEDIPFVIQYNKRDMPNIVPVEDLRRSLNPWGVPDFEAVAIDGTGVFETLKAISKLVIKEISKQR